MPNFIIKAAPDEDFYVFWSTIVDAPTAWGTRLELSANSHDPRAVAAERFDRADANGTSACWEGFADEDQPYGWTDADVGGLGECGPRTEREDGCWILPRANLRAFCERGAGEGTEDLLRWDSFDDHEGDQ